ncbi:CPBP family intramembrane glutamic endopeptidase [Alkalihalobacterium bogoriense]|uniref:CPBP family intramembrane glutamic endopeptidase n=1 Tax=Alkalihalobacterium bogoriense TaxID=246272 RepID=UPI00047CA2B7|nr:type II CAAX endopeptidase family protein [Alkalihalobacterium bogoriense]
MNRQAKLIQQMTDKDILINLYVTQLIMLSIAFVLGWIFFDSWESFSSLFQWNFREIFIIGGGIAFIVILIDIVLYRFLPSKWLDDGGINERVFRNRHPFHILILALFIAISEEVLFRGILQTHLGFIPASLLFAVVHVRYISKIVLFTMTVSVSFVLGWAFLFTGNLLVPIFAHFLIDFVLGLFIQKGKAKV